MSENVAIFIPARMESVRFPGKPLIDIAGKPMIVHVLERCQLAGVNGVFVACAEQEIADVVQKHGGQAVITDPAHASGTDRIAEALERVGGDYEVIVNVQGDLPLIDPAIITKAVGVLNNTEVDIATLVSTISSEHERDNPNVVKAVISFAQQDSTTGKALYFTRANAPYGAGDLYHHIGLYAYRKKALKQFVALPPSPLEKREKLEQLRALEHGMRIDVAVVDTVPLGVDTPEDLQHILQVGQFS